MEVTKVRPSRTWFKAWPSRSDLAARTDSIKHARYEFNERSKIDTQRPEGMSRREWKRYKATLARLQNQ